MNTMDEDIEKNKKLDVFVEDFSDKVGEVQDILKSVDEYIQTLNHKISESSKQLTAIQKSNILNHYNKQLEDIQKRSEKLNEYFSKNLQEINKQINNVVEDYKKLGTSNEQFKQLKENYEEIKKNAKEYQVGLQKSHETIQSTIQELSDIGEQIIIAQKKEEEIIKQNLSIMEKRLDTQISRFNDLKNKFQIMTEQKNDFDHEFSLIDHLSNNLNTTLQEIREIRADIKKSTVQLKATANEVQGNKTYAAVLAEQSLKEYKTSLDKAKGEIIKEIKDVQNIHMVKLENERLHYKIKTQEIMIQKIKEIILKETLPPAPAADEIKMPMFMSDKALASVNDIYDKEQELNEIMNYLASELKIKRNV